MKHLIMGTAGHVDHGKTALIRALTEFDCDTHKEEKERGITIHLGFTHLDLPNDTSIGIIDVPGHKDFINTMISGASTIDFVLFTIAADSSIMPQTKEHLQIMELLDIENGIIAITKADLVDNEILELVEMEIQEYVEGTFLENAPIVRTSIKDNSGIDQLIQEITQLSERIEQRTEGSYFRMYIDRIFSVQGFGTVVNGSVLKGHATRATNLYVLPGQKSLRIRGIQHHGEDVESVSAGDRASLNISGLDVDEFQRGMLLSEKIIKPTTMLDAEITMFDNDRTLTVWNHALFLLGTFDDQVRIHLLDKDELHEKEKGLVQIHFENPCYPLYGDYFIIRSTSNDITLGGGKILDPYPLHHKRRTRGVVTNLRDISNKGLIGFISAQVMNNSSPITLSELTLMTNMQRESLFHLITSAIEDTIGYKNINNEMLLFSRSTFDKVHKNIHLILQKHHLEHPLIQKGKTLDELISILGFTTDNQIAFLNVILETMIQQGLCKKIDRTYSLSERKAIITEDLREKIKTIESYLIRCGLTIPSYSQIESYAQDKNIPVPVLNQVLEYLVENKRVIMIEGFFIHSSLIKNAEKVLLDYYKTHDRITVAEFRDLLQGNRKICLLILNYFDDKGITLRQGDYRKLRKARNKE